MVTEKEAINKYGKKTYLKMARFLEDVIICYDNKGEIDIPEADLELAYALVTKSKNFRSVES